MTNEQIVEMIQRDDTEEQKMLFAQLWKQCERFIHKRAGQWMAYAEHEDLMQQGFIILHDAAADYDPEAGTLFVSYLGQRLSWGWARYLEECGQPVRLPAHMIQKIREYERIRQSHLQEHGAEPRDDVLSGLLGVDLETVHMIRETAQKRHIRSLNEPVTSEDDAAELGDLLPDESDLEEECVERVYKEQLARTIWPMVDELSERQAEVIYDRYRRNMSIAEISRRRGEPRHQTRKDHNDGIRELQKPQRRKKLLPYTDSIYMKPLRGTGLTQFKTTFTSVPEREAVKAWFRDGRSS